MKNSSVWLSLKNVIVIPENTTAVFKEHGWRNINITNWIKKGQRSDYCSFCRGFCGHSIFDNLQRDHDQLFGRLKIWQGWGNRDHPIWATFKRVDKNNFILASESLMKLYILHFKYYQVSAKALRANDPITCISFRLLCIRSESGIRQYVWLSTIERNY